MLWIICLLAHAVGAPQNEAAQPIAMTAPVVNTPTKRMQFILPSSMQTAPPPLGKNVKLVERPASRWAVATWYGGWNDKVASRRLAELREALRRDGVVVDETQWELHRYNPPWTLPAYKKNSVAVKVLVAPPS